MADLASISALATAGGTLVLALATFASVRSANRAARAAERSLLAGLRPLLVTSRLTDPGEKVGFADGRWLKVDGGHAGVEVTDDAIYLVLALRNAGSGIAVLHGWWFAPEALIGRPGHAPPEDFRRLTRDIYLAGGDLGFWQGALRDTTAPEFEAARAAILARNPVTVEVLYGDHEGGQRTISRFGLTPREDGRWLAAVARHWNLDRLDPR